MYSIGPNNEILNQPSESNLNREVPKEFTKIIEKIGNNILKMVNLNNKLNLMPHELLNPMLKSFIDYFFNSITKDE